MHPDPFYTTLFLQTLLMVLWPFYDKSTPKDHVPFQGNARKVILHVYR